MTSIFTDQVTKQTCWTGFLPLLGDENIVFEAKDSLIVTLFTPWLFEADLVELRRWIG
jgi:hypothetical protein